MTQASKSKKSKGKRLVTNLREAPYSLKDGDVVAVVDRMEDEFAHADLTRADDEVARSKIVVVSLPSVADLLVLIYCCCCCCCCCCFYCGYVAVSSHRLYCAGWGLWLCWQERQG